MVKEITNSTGRIAETLICPLSTWQCGLSLLTETFGLIPDIRHKHIPPWLWFNFLRSPTYDKAVAPHSAGVIPSGADRGELPGRRRGLATTARAPAREGAIGPHPAGVVQAALMETNLQDEGRTNSVLSSLADSVATGVAVGRGRNGCCASCISAGIVRCRPGWCVGFLAAGIVYRPDGWRVCRHRDSPRVRCPRVVSDALPSEL